MATPDGKLLVYRVPTSSTPATRYDVIDRSGRVERQLVLPSSDIIRGFGEKSAYVVTSDSLYHTVKRHPWP